MSKTAVSSASHVGDTAVLPDVMPSISVLNNQPKSGIFATMPNLKKLGVDPKPIVKQKFCARLFLVGRRGCPLTRLSNHPRDVIRSIKRLVTPYGLNKIAPLLAERNQQR